MDVKAFPALIVGVVVALVLAGAVLPVFAETTSETATIKNEGMRYTTYETGTAHTITFTSDSMITDGDKSQKLPDTSVYGGATIAYGTNGIVRYMSDGGVSWWGSISGQGTNRYMGGVSTVTITISDDGSAFVTAGGVNRNLGLIVLYPDPNGALSLSYNPYIKEDSPIYGAGTTTTEGTSYGINWSGDMQNITVNPMVPPVQEIGTSTINTSTVSGYEGLYKVNSVVIPNTTAGADFTYTYFFAPYQLTVDKTVHPDGALSVMLNVLPLLAIAGLVTGAVVWFINRKG